MKADIEGIEFTNREPGHWQARELMNERLIKQAVACVDHLEVMEYLLQDFPPDIIIGREIDGHVENVRSLIEEVKNRTNLILKLLR